MTYTLRELQRAEAKQVYDEQMQRDFPPDELKSWACINSMLDDGIYRTYGLYQDGSLCAYAFLLDAADSQLQLLDYLAVLADRRGNGHGSEMLKQLNLLPGKPLFLEVEDTAFATNDADLQLRRRRIHFYEKNGMRMSGVRACLFDCPFAIMYSGAPLADEIIYTALTNSYRCVRSYVRPDLQKDENFMVSYA